MGGPVTVQTWDQPDLKITRMDFKDQTNSSSWISLINTVFASIAILPVFLVWFLGIITDSIEEKENPGDRVIILEENDTEEVQETKGEERHLYVIPNLRKDSNLMKYQQYCTYPGLDCHTRPEAKNESQAEQDLGEIQQIKSNNFQQNSDNPSSDKENTKLVAAPFQWPTHSDVIEQLRTFRNKDSALSDEMKKKLENVGILRQDTDSDEQISPVKIEDHAWLSGHNIPKKQIHAFWDKFETKARPGLQFDDSTPNHSPSPKSRKPLKKINLEKCTNLESRVKQKKYLKNIKHQNNLVRAF